MSAPPKYVHDPLNRRAPSLIQCGECGGEQFNVLEYFERIPEGYLLQCIACGWEHET